uniref:B30.2/SPRY domain-containing protein n=1 Tax=Oreochromis aureus TaxID=47969 RepID=A0A668UW16_OREAU
LRQSADMSAASNLRSEDQFLCSICLDVFTDPVSTPCGHNFCKTCISQHWDMNQSCKCPMCNETFNIRPQLRVNTFISEQMIQKRQLKIQEVFTALKESVERRLKKFIKEIEDKQEATEKQAEGLIKDLEQEISELMERSSKVEQISCSEDHLHLLQSFSSLKAAPPTKDWTEVRVHPPSYEGTVVRAVAQLDETVWKYMNDLFDAELQQVQQYAVDVTLDPDTAQTNLILSDDGKQVHCGDVRKNLPDNPERFSDCVMILGEQSFSSGRFYFEVQVKGKTKWDLGVARESINRKGKITLSPQNGFWTVVLRNGNEYIACADPPVRLFLLPGPEKVGVFVDYEEGLVSFYDVGAAALIYSFTGCSFTHKLHPYFCPSLSYCGKNSAPLIICPCKYSV